MKESLEELLREARIELDNNTWCCYDNSQGVWIMREQSYRAKSSKVLGHYSTLKAALEANLSRAIREA